VTFSGGEPLAQPDFLTASAKAFRERGFHLAVETSGLWPAGLLDGLISSFDLILFDLKHVDPVKFRTAIHRDNRAILSNLKALLASDANIELRVSLIPGFNDSEADLAAIAQWLNDAKARRPLPIRLLPFHRMARSKQHLFARTYHYESFTPLSEGDLQKAAGFLRAQGLSVL